MNHEDCENCNWIAYNPTEDKEVCALQDDNPISEIENCNPNNLTDEQENLIINEGRGK